MRALLFSLWASVCFVVHSTSVLFTAQRQWVDRGF